MKSPRVTVLMAVFNGGRYLRESIESILGQTFSDFEFLIINDGSTDNSVHLIESYDDPRIRLIHNDGNMGLAASLNKGLRLAHGEYVARMDADDISVPERLECQVSFMDSHSQVGVCGSWVRYFPAAGNSVWKLPKGTEEILCWQFHSVGVAHPTVIMRKQLFIDYGLEYDLHYRYIEDFELWGRAIEYMDFANIQKVLLEYRINPAQTCTVHAVEQLAEVAPLRLHLVKNLGIEPTYDEQQLHEMVMNGTLPPEATFLDRAEKWLLRLELANRSVHKYSVALFSRRLLEVWFSVCLGFSDKSACSLRRCLKSPLWFTTNLSVWFRLRAFGAWVMQKGIWKAFCEIRHA